MATLTGSGQLSYTTARDTIHGWSLTEYMQRQTDGAIDGARQPGLRHEMGAGGHGVRLGLQRGLRESAELERQPLRLAASWMNANSTPLRGFLLRSQKYGVAMAGSRIHRSRSCIERGEASPWYKLGAMLIVVAGLALVTAPGRAQSSDEAGEVSAEAPDLEGMVVTLQSQYEELKAKFDQLTASHRDLDRRYTALDRVQAELQVKYTQLASSNGALVNNYAALEQAYTQVLDENTQLRLSIHANAMTVRTAAERVVGRTVISASRSLSSVAGQAIPYAGVTIILGLTAREIDDACDTLKDINRMNSAIGDQPFDPSIVCGMQVPASADVLTQVTNNWGAAYQSAAVAINAAGQRVPATPPTPSWISVKTLVCPVVGRVPRVC
jgi:hypothetical protein